MFYVDAAAAPRARRRQPPSVMPFSPPQKARRTMRAAADDAARRKCRYSTRRLMRYDLFFIPARACYYLICATSSSLPAWKKKLYAARTMRHGLRPASWERASIPRAAGRCGAPAADPFHQASAFRRHDGAYAIMKSAAKASTARSLAAERRLSVRA